MVTAKGNKKSTGQRASGPFETVLLDSLRPATINDEIYKPVDTSDPSIQRLAESISKNGLDPLVVTTDNVIVSGHRRRAACLVLGRETVTVRRVGISSDHPDFPAMLVRFNDQRVKGADELLREELVRTDPAEAHGRLLRHRAESTRVKIETIRIQGQTKRAQFSAAKRPFLDAAKAIISDLRKFWPLTVRQVHYQLLNVPPLIHANKPDSRYVNQQKCYKALCDLLIRARLFGEVPVEAIDDETRVSDAWDVHPSVGPFARRAFDNFLKGYARDLMASQPLHLEILGEKLTIKGIVEPIAWRYAIPLTIGRGYSSLSPRHKMVERFKQSRKSKMVVLVLSDFDPEGEDIPHNFARSLRDDFLVHNVEAVKVALTRGHIDRFNLPPVFTAKEKSSRRNGFVKATGGESVFELEALRPQDLQAVLDEAIRGVIDINLFNQEIEAEAQDAAKIEALRATATSMLSTQNWDMS